MRRVDNVRPGESSRAQGPCFRVLSNKSLLDGSTYPAQFAMNDKGGQRKQNARLDQVLLSLVAEYEAKELDLRGR